MGTLVLYSKASYFLSLFDSIAPLIDIIIQIFNDIRYFFFVMCIYTFMIATCFHLLAKNQLDFDNIDNAIDEAKVTNNYGDTRWNSIFYGINLWIGGADTSGFGVGDASQYWYLIAIWMISIILILIHFMNMLIAIMGNTFAIREAVGKQIMLRDHLRFVMDNWILIHVAVDYKNLKYIVGAFQADEEGGDNEEITLIKENLDSMKNQMNDQFKKNAIMNRDTQLLVQDIQKRIEVFSNPGNNN